MVLNLSGCSLKIDGFKLKIHTTDKVEEHPIEQNPRESDLKIIHILMNPALALYF